MEGGRESTASAKPATRLANAIADFCNKICQERTPLASFDDVVGDRQKPGRHLEAERPCRLEVAEQLEAGRLEDRHVRRLGALQDAAD